VADEGVLGRAGVDEDAIAPAMGGYQIRGLSNAIFAHESMPFVTPPWQQVLDTLDSSIAKRREELRQTRRRRFNPLYWGDRILSAVLGLPAYLVGRVLRIPPERIEGSHWGTPIRLAGLILQIALVIIGGRQVGFW
jgi:hypothetical protein